MCQVNETMCVLQILNTTGDVKSAQYIADVCIQLMKELQRDVPYTTVVGFIMDSAAANRAAYDILEGDDQLDPLVNLPCGSHTLSLLLKDLYKRFQWIRQVFDDVLFISTAINGSDQLKGIFAEVCAVNASGRAPTLQRHCETRFGSKFIVLRSVASKLDELVALAGHRSFIGMVRGGDTTAARLHSILSNIGPTGLHSRAPVVLELCEPVFRHMIELEANKPYLSRTLVLIKELEAHFDAFAEKYADPVFTQGRIEKRGTVTDTTLDAVVYQRLRSFYYRRAFAAAFLLDPVNFSVTQKSGTTCFRLPYSGMPDSEQRDALADIKRLAGAKSETVVSELASLNAHGFSRFNELDERTVLNAVNWREIEHDGGDVKRVAAPVE